MRKKGVGGWQNGKPSFFFISNSFNQKRTTLSVWPEDFQILSVCVISVKSNFQIYPSNLISIEILIFYRYMISSVFSQIP